MKRLVLLAGALAVTTAAHAADETDFKANGEYRVRYFNDMTPSGLKDQPNNKSDIEGRMKLDLTLRKGEKFQAHTTLFHGSKFGDVKALNGGATDYSAHNANNGLIVNQAYGWWKAGESYSLKAGRFNVELGGGEFFSADSWNLIPTTHEGFLGTFDTDFASVAAALIKVSEGGAGVASADSDPEAHNIIVSADVKNMPEALKTANLTIVQMSKTETSTPASGAMNAQHLGVTLGGDMSNVFWKAVAAFQMGVASKTATTETKLAGSMFDVTVGYGMPETMGMKVWANYHMDSGDDSATDDKIQNYQSLFYDSHKFAGRMDMFGWGNLTYWNVGASMAAADDMEVGLALYGFSKSKDTDATLNASGGFDRFAAFRGGAAAGKADLGMEFDVWATQKYASNFSIDANFGMFMPGAAFKDATPKREATIMQLMLAGTMMF